MGEKKADQSDSKLSSDAGSLSGGERSFSTLAFVLALGDDMKSPFRVT